MTVVTQVVSPLKRLWTCGAASSAPKGALKSTFGLPATGEAPYQLGRRGKPCHAWPHKCQFWNASL